MEVILMQTTYLNEKKHEIYHCTGFGVCRGGYLDKVSPCPVHTSSAGFEAETPKGIMTLGRDLLEKRINYSRPLADVIYRCTMCGNCRLLCGATNFETMAPLFDPAEINLAMRTDLVDLGVVPSPVRDYLESMQKRGNPFKKAQKYRGQWAETADVDIYDNHEYLFYIGCVGSFDERGNAIAEATAKLLQRAGVSFGILGSEEGCDGNEVKKLGEQWLFEEMAQKNIETFKQKGIQKIITLSPHSYNAFKNDYPSLGGTFDVQPVSRILKELLDANRLETEKSFNARVAFHDPCLLGRQNGEYDSPRQVLNAVPGLKLVEMPRNRENALCCGGGGGNFFTDMIGSGQNSPARQRVREAIDTGVEILAVSCPTCANMLQDAVKAEWIEDKLKIMDISEILMSVLASA